MRYDEDDLELMSDEVFEDLESTTVECRLPRLVPTPGHWIECLGPDEDCRNSVWYMVARGDTLRSVAEATLRANNASTTTGSTTRYVSAMGGDLSNSMFGPMLMGAFRPVWRLGRERGGSGYGLILLPKVGAGSRMLGPGGDMRRAAGTTG